MEKKKYNLRSQKSDISQVQFGLHLSDDNEFVTNLLGQNHNMSHQDSDSSASDSELDCGQIILNWRTNLSRKQLINLKSRAAEYQKPIKVLVPTKQTVLKRKKVLPLSTLNCFPSVILHRFLR